MSAGKIFLYSMAAVGVMHTCLWFLGSAGVGRYVACYSVTQEVCKGLKP
jgi:hypothetical protein